MPLLSVSAHFDGERVLLDEDVQIRPNARLLVTVLDEADPDRQEFLRLAQASLADAYAEDDVEYTEADLRP